MLLGVTLSETTGNRPIHRYREELMNERNFALRPEAGPVPYESLIKCQKDAFGKILAALAEAQQSITDAKRQQEPFSQHGMSRIFFVSGEPGSGKSSLYFTLREILRKESSLSELRKKHPEKFGSLEGLAPAAIHWLDLIDLEVTGDEGENLLAAVLVRISRALDRALVIRPGAGSTACCQEAINQLEILANDIGIAWDGNLQARASSLDPDSYSQEVMSAQRARLRINERLCEALNKLSDEGCYGCTSETLFILPVDDFYLKPAVSLELLRLLRMISVPRLFFLIMGEEKNMQALFLDKALADWTAIAGPQVFGALKDRQQEVLSRAREMSARYFRKLLPIGQRAELDAMNWKEALQYTPPAETTSSDVSQLLSSITVCTAPPSEASNLLEFLTTAKTRKSLQLNGNGAGSRGNTSNRIKRLEEGYSALHILEAGPREVMDLWKVLHELPKNKIPCKDKAPAYLEKLLQIVIRTIEEQNFLTEKQQELLRSAFPLNYDAGPVETDKFELKTKDRAFRGTPPETETETLWWRKHPGWRMYVSDNSVEKDKGKRKGNEAFSHLPPRQAGWIILLHDLSISWDWERSITDNLVHKVCKSLKKPIKHNPGPKCPGWLWRPQEEDKNGEKRQTKTWEHFSIPDFQTFRQLDRFLAIWNDGLSNLGSESLSSESLTGLWERASSIAAGPDDCYDREMEKIEEKEPMNKEKEDSLKR